MRIAIPDNLTERTPCDLSLVIALTLACILFVLAPRLNESPVRMVLGLLLVLFLPGYSLIAALFPRKDDLDSVERIALSFGLSIAVVPLIGMGLNYTPFGIRLVPVLLGLSAFTILLAVIAGVRRVWMPEAERFVVAVGGWGQWLGLGLGRGGDGGDGGRGRSSNGSGGEDDGSGGQSGGQGGGLA